MKYIVTLLPLAPYFFGGEVTLGDGTTQNYFVTSNLLPQPSALIGLMRYDVLRQHGLLSYNPTEEETLAEVKRLIGEKGLDLELPSGSYGLIQKISPVFITDGVSHYTPMPLDHGLTMEMSASARCSYGGNEVKKVPVAPHYKEKEYDNYLYWCDSKGNRRNDIFLVSQQIGIHKNQSGDTEENSFFKQSFIQLNEGLKMAFTIETSEPLDTGSRMITLGGNRSMFKMEVQESAVNWKETFQSLHREERLLALGDLWLTAEERAKCDFIWGTSKDFRYMTNETSKAHSWEKPKKSRLYHLLNRGCVIYADSTVLKEIEKKHANLQLAGLNLLV